MKPNMLYPIGLQNFEEIRNGAYVYVDKTAHIYHLATTGKYYFLSRPRRFGKSLLISTMDAYFSGKKELFEGLAMGELEQDWIKYTVLRLDLNSGGYKSERDLNDILIRHLNAWELLYGRDEIETSPSLRFLGVVQRACEKTGRQVVILIDEYDKPILQTIDNPELQDSYRSTLKAFYSVLKTYDQYIKFAFLTGVTKFSKLSVFSDLNNLEDISMLERYADICGMTETEIHSYFEEPIKELAANNNLSYGETCERLREQYDGYHFEHDTVGIYNPFSLLNTFKNLKFGDYWFSTGTPTFLVKLLKQNNYDLNNLQVEDVLASTLWSVDSVASNPIPVIYQSGYLTIKGYDDRFRTYLLGFPNKEVERGFIESLRTDYLPEKNKQSSFGTKRFVQCVEQGRVDEFLSLMQTMLDDGDYRIQGEKELYFQNSMYLIFKMMGFYIEVEHATAMGRVDVIVKTKDYIYVIELKLDGTPEEALQQIEEKGYALPFANDPRKLIKVGVNFSSETRSLVEWKIE